MKNTSNSTIFSAFTSKSQSLSRHASNTSIAIQTDEPLTKKKPPINRKTENLSKWSSKNYRWKLFIDGA